MKNRLALIVPAALAVVLWIVGLVLSQGVTDKLSENASDAQVLAWVRSNSGLIIVGSWLFMLGCVAFVWFAALLRERLATAEGGPHTLSTLVFGGAVASSVLGLGTVGDIASAINKNDVSPATAGALHHVGDLFFMGAELSLVSCVAAASILALRTGVLPRWWAAFGLLLSVVLLIGPIGWAGLIFGTPIWTIGTSLLVGLQSRRARVSVPAVA